ncbi:sensor histidine kinase [Methanospirillum sp.]|jgi:signal transduction histidine kinase|uniref:sensor histidine kinase n=1 Tax=Methanospirillum sp. TaxID=45200 RepID=UPI001BD1BD9E|nr:sensor histidine kinase [Methanospirillum sp.]
MNSPEPGFLQGIPWKKSLGVRITWIAILVTITSLIITGAGLIVIAGTGQQQNVYDLQENRVDAVALLISSFVNAQRSELQIFEELTPLSSMSRSKQQISLEELLISRQKTLSQVTLLGTDGSELIRLSRFHTFLPGEMSDQADNPAFQSAMQGLSYISEIYVSPDSGLLSMQIAIPVKTDTGEITGVILAEENAVRLWSEVSRTNVGETGYVYLVDRQGRFIAYYELSEVLQNYGREMLHVPPVQDFVSGKPVSSRIVYEYPGMNGEDVIGVYAPIEGTEWAVVTELPAKEAYEGITSMKNFLYAAIILAIIGTGLLVFTLTRRTITPLRALIDIARRIGTGDLDTYMVRADREDEVGVLAVTMNHMQNELNKLYRDLEQQVEELRINQQVLSQARNKLNILNTVTFQDIQNALFSMHGYLLMEEAQDNPDPEKIFSRQKTGIERISSALRFADKFQNLGLNPPEWQKVSQSFLYAISHLDLSSLSRDLQVDSLEIFADPLLESVFFILTENVIRHGKNANAITVHFEERSVGLTLFFEDNGSGVPNDLKEKIFDLSYETDKDRGLFLVREILSVTGITISENGEWGKGARFEILIPDGAWRYAEP